MSAISRRSWLRGAGLLAVALGTGCGRAVDAKARFAVTKTDA